MSLLTKDHPILTFAEVYAIKLPRKGLFGNIYYEQHCSSSVISFHPTIQLDEVDKERVHEAIHAFGIERVEVIGSVAKDGTFTVYDVKFGDNYLAIPQAKSVATYLKIPFIRHKKMSTKSLRRIKKYKPVQLRPLDEFVLDDGTRLTAEYIKGEIQ